MVRLGRGGMAAQRLHAKGASRPPILAQELHWCNEDQTSKTRGTGFVRVEVARSGALSRWLIDVETLAADLLGSIRADRGCSGVDEQGEVSTKGHGC
ncbi:hypothetical protein NL676_012358 [Syzygium grande]|nr:hypothetical protein NL676_012358 [Syzygium grande]